jgi:hypothetical protein
VTWSARPPTRALKADSRGLWQRASSTPIRIFQFGYQNTTQPDLIATAHCGLGQIDVLSDVSWTLAKESHAGL